MDKESDQAQNSIKMVAENLPDGRCGDLQVIENVKVDLVKSGVSKAQAPQLATRVVQTVASYHSGPLPSVNEFNGYEQICPGAARDILDMAKSDQAHQQLMDGRHFYGEMTLKIIGMIVVVLILLIMIGGSIFAATLGFEKLAIVIASGSGLALVAGVAVRILLGRQPKTVKSPQPVAKPTRKKKT